MGKQLERIQQEAEVMIAEVVESQNTEADLRNLVFQMGQLDAISSIANNLNTALIVRLQRIRDEKLYAIAGYERFDDFLDKFEQSPMAYKRFNYIENIFKGLGPDVFDLASANGLSVRQMKLLGKGNVEVEDGIVKVTIGEETIETPIENRRQWLQTLKVLADSNADKTAKLEKQAEKISKYDAQKRELYDELDRVKAAKRAEVNDDPHSHAIVNLTFAYQNLVATVGDMNEIERQQFVAQDFELIAALMTDLAAAYGRDDWTKLGARTPSSGSDANGAGDDIDAILENALNEGEAALAASL